MSHSIEVPEVEHLPVRECHIALENPSFLEDGASKGERMILQSESDHAHVTYVSKTATLICGI